MENQAQTRRAPLLPTYHEIVSGEAKYVYSTSAEALSAQLAVLSREQAIGWPALPHATFDDAYQSHYELGLPALEANHLKGIFFAIADRTQSSPEYMRWSQLRELIQLGHEVQSHGLSHVPLTICRNSDLRRELEVSRSMLSDKLGVQVNAISIPYGRWDNRVLRACRRAGYTRVYTSDPRPYAAHRGLELIGRFMVRNVTTPERFRQSMLPSPAHLLLMRAQHAAKRGLRRLVGDRNYHKLWCYMSGRESENMEYEFAGNENPATNQ